MNYTQAIKNTLFVLLLQTYPLCALETDAINQRNVVNSSTFNVKKAAKVTYRIDVIKENKQEGYGMGVALSSDGKLITAYHVINNYSKVRAINSNGVEYNASVVSISPKDDLAYLSIDVKDIPYVKLAKTSNLGDEIYTYSANKILLKGIISQLKEDDIMLSVDSIEGMSGEGIFNSDTKLVGILLGKDHLEHSSYGVRVKQFANINQKYSPSRDKLFLESNNYDTSYCYDKDDLAIWKRLSTSDDWRVQELHALFIGLCKKVEKRDLNTDRAQFIFENAKRRLLSE